MKRYLLFCYDRYYPTGPYRDQQGSFDTLEEAAETAKKLKYDYYSVLDMETREWIVRERGPGKQLYKDKK